MRQDIWKWWRGRSNELEPGNATTKPNLGVHTTSRRQFKEKLGGYAGWEALALCNFRKDIWVACESPDGGKREAVERKRRRCAGNERTGKKCFSSILCRQIALKKISSSRPKTTITTCHSKYQIIRHRYS